VVDLKDMDLLMVEEEEERINLLESFNPSFKKDKGGEEEVDQELMRLKKKKNNLKLHQILLNGNKFLINNI